MRDAEGVLYAGTSPNGAVYRIDASGHATEVWKSPAKYIWALQAASDGTIFAATGQPGNVYRIQPNGRAELYFQTGQGNVTALALGTQGHLYAGSDPNGLLYDITGMNRGTVVMDSTLPEIRAIRVAPDGSLYVAAMGGAVSSRSGNATLPSSAASSVATANSPTVITVTADASASEPTAGHKENPGENRQVEGAVKPNANQSKMQTQATTSAASPSAAVVDTSGVEKSAIYRITTDGTVETLRSSKEDNVYDLWLEPDGSLLFSTDVYGRIYRWQNDKTMLLTEPGDGEATTTAAGGNDAICGAEFSGAGVCVRLEQEGRGQLRIRDTRCGFGGAMGSSAMAWRGDRRGI